MCTWSPSPIDRAFDFWCKSYHAEPLGSGRLVGLWSASRFKDLIHVLLTIFGCCFQVMQLFVKIRDIGLQLCDLGGQSALNCFLWIEDKPGHIDSALFVYARRRDCETHIFPTPSYTLVSVDSCLTSVEVSSSIRMSRCFADTAALTILISR